MSGHNTPRKEGSGHNDVGTQRIAAMRDEGFTPEALASEAAYAALGSQSDGDEAARREEIRGKSGNRVRTVAELFEGTEETEG